MSTSLQPLELTTAQPPFLRGVTLITLQSFMGELLGLVHVEALIEGNVTSEEAATLASSVLELLPGDRLSIAERPKDSIAHIPAGSSYLFRHNPLLPSLTLPYPLHPPFTPPPPRM